MTSQHSRSPPLATPPSSVSVPSSPTVASPSSGSAASISIRKHIRWLPERADEPTSTVVLTSPSGFFVDIRILNPDSVVSPFDSNASSLGLAAALPLERLDWAFAGTCSSTPLPPQPRRKSAHTISNSHSRHGSDASGSGVSRLSLSGSSSAANNGAAGGRHTAWTHWIDSRVDTPATAPSDRRTPSLSEALSKKAKEATHETATAAAVGGGAGGVGGDSGGGKDDGPPIAGETNGNDNAGKHQDAEDPPDEADCYPYGHAANHTLEKGRMRNPATGQLTEYEELWRELTPRRLPGDADGDRPGIVLRAENRDLATCGLVVRVGDWVQGLLRVGGDITAERWRFFADDGGGAVSAAGGGVGGGVGGGSGSAIGGLGSGAVGAGAGTHGLGGLDDPLSLAATVADRTGVVAESGTAAGKQGWHRLAKVGSRKLPSQVCWERPELVEGGDVICGGLKWEVVERFA